MRAFIAIPIPKEIKDVLFDIQNVVGNEYAKIKWIAKKNLHLTLKFFPYISEEKIKKVVEILKTVKIKPFEVELSEIGFFPNLDSVRVIWVGLEPAEKVLNLQGEIDSKLAELFEMDKMFKVHLSLGRVKFVKNKEGLIKKLKEIKIPKLKFKISGFELIQSNLTKDGPVYKIIEKF